MLIVLTGLPGSGKSYFAKELIKHRPDYLLFNKDTVRTFLFSEKYIDYSTNQDDLCIDVIFRVMEYLYIKNNDHVFILDGRTFSKKYQVDYVLTQSKSMSIPVKFVQFSCCDAVAKSRIEKELGVHDAMNRDYQLYLKLKEEYQPLEIPYLSLTSDQNEPIANQVTKVLEYVDRK